MVSVKFSVILLVFLVLTSVQGNSLRFRRSSASCGVPHGTVGYVFNGKETGRYEHPWKAALTKLSRDGSDYEYFCGGVLIDDRTVVTAAHCLVQTSGTTLLPRDITVILGAHNIAKRIEPGRFNAVVKSIKVHDKWNPQTVDYEGDIAVLKLSNPVAFTEFINAACIANWQTSSIVDGVVAGWGVHDDTDVPSDVSRKIDIPILGDRECLKKNPGLLPILSDDLFCAGKTGAGVCKGDSGSGFYVQQNGRFYLRGIVSSSTIGLCSRTDTALYSDILKNLNFIQGNLAVSTTTTTAAPTTAKPKATWKIINNKSRIPDNSAFAGYDKDKNKVYVGRYEHETQGWIAAKIVDRPHETACYYSFHYKEYECSNFQVLTDLPSNKYFWKQHNYTLPSPTCYVNTKDYFGIGRATVEEEAVVGKIHFNGVDYKTLIAPYGGKEHVINSYEYLLEEDC